SRLSGSEQIVGKMSSDVGVIQIAAIG
ncbi:MAG: hypothetical protein K0Q54_1222, partial [Methylobacterium brachiatum]|nr:hypothetical protein [Methylobacterium brachiatum]